MRPNPKKTHHKKGLLEWLKVYALSSNPSLKKSLKIELLCDLAMPPLGMYLTESKSEYNQDT
jgi:hypothetical protein